MTSVDPLHDGRPNSVCWSRTNMAEAIPGVPTPLDWTFWARCFADTSRAIFFQVGALSRREAHLLPTRLEDQFVTAFYGRPVVNVDQLRAMAARLPGGDPDAIELQLLGSVRAGAARRPVRRRWPVVAVKAPVAVGRLPRRVRAARVATGAWWQTWADETRYATAEAAAAGLASAYDRFVWVNHRHGLNVFVGQAAYDRVAKLCVAAGSPGLELQLTAAGTRTEETAVVDDVWRAARGELTVDDLVARHGYHGPDEGVLSGRSWRQDPAPLHALVLRYKDTERDTDRVARHHDIRAAAQRELLAALPRLRRAQARAVLRFADRHVPLRETGKAAFLQAIDVARAAARALGRHLLDDPDDIFFFTLEEAMAGPSPPGDVRDDRRRRHADYCGLDVPQTFVGIPEPILDTPASVPDALGVVGIPASAGVAEGTARVVLDPAGLGRVQPGDVLVCPLTDPGWAPFFELASAVVIDLGGPLSHGAIVAREIGIPCVINTGDGTRRIPDGSTVRVDGSSGTVQLTTPGSLLCG